MSAEVPEKRREQGWRVTIPTAAPGTRSELIQAHLREPSVVSVVFNVQSTGDVDGAGFITCETRIQEAVRSRTFSARTQGFAFNTPAGVTRVFASSFAKQYSAWIQVAPGFTSTEHLGETVQLQAFETRTIATPAFARALKITAALGLINVNLGSNQAVIQCQPGSNLQPQWIDIPADGSVTISTNGAAFGAIAALIWEVTA